MKASYDLTRDDLAAFIEYHQTKSPTARNQKLGCFVFALAGLLVLPVGLVLTSEEPRLQTAMAIWPLFLGPMLFAIFAIPYVRWRTRRLTRRILNEGKNTGFYGKCELTVDGDGLTETRPSGSTTRNWSSVERIVTTRHYLLVYTSGIEAYVVPRRAFRSESEFNQLASAIAGHSGIQIDGDSTLDT